MLPGGAVTAWRCLISFLSKVCCLNQSEKISATFFPVVLFFLVLSVSPNAWVPAKACAAEKSNVVSANKVPLTQEEKNWLAQHPVIRARVGNAQPLHFFDGKNRGISVDYLDLIAEYVGLEIEYVHDVSWTDALENIKEHQVVDVLLTAKNTEERRNDMLFSDDYLFMSMVIFTRTKSGFVGSIDDLFGKTLSVENNYVIHKKLASEYPQIKLLAKENTLEALQAVATGEADAYIGNLTISTYLLHEYNLTNLKIACPAPFDNHNQAFAIRNDWPELVSIINKALAAITPQEDAEIRDNWLSLRYEYWINKKDVFTWAAAVFAVFGIALGLFVVWNRRLQSEIDEREYTEKSLRESQRALSTLMGNLPGMAYRCLNTPEWPMTFVSEGAFEITGFPPSDISNQTPFKYGALIHPDDKEVVWNSVQVCVEKGVPFTLTYRILDRQGQEKWVWEQGQGVCNDQGELVALEGFIADITEHKQAEEERVRLMRAIEQVAETVIITDVQGKIQYVNPAFEQTTGYTCGEAIGRNPRILKSEEQDDAFYKEMWETLWRGETWNGRIINRKKDGTLFTEEATISPVRDSLNRTVNYVAVKRDISGELELEEKFRQTQKMEAIGTLAGGIAHDFNNILSVIVGYAEFIQEEVSEESAIGENIAEILKAGKRAADLVGQILTFSRKADIVKEPLDPHLIVKEALIMLHATLPATVRIEEDIDPDCGTILANSTNLHQIVMNLCANALHSMPDEKGVLTVRMHERELSNGEIPREQGISPGRFVVLSVSDTGCGMDKETFPRIFDPYFTTKEVGQGTGLGLSVIHGIVQDYKGFIEVESCVGRGTTFSIFLPTTEEPVWKSRSLGQKNESEIMSGMESVLIVDDELLLVKINAKRLEKRGYQVTALTDSREALLKFQDQPDNFDLLITDQTMPGLSGAELAKAVLEIKPSLPIIMCTGHSDIIPEEKALSMGIKRYVFKPVRGDELLDAVRELLDKK